MLEQNFRQEKKYFFKTNFFDNSGMHKLPKFKIWMQSDKNKPLSAHDSDRKELTQNVHGVLQPWRIQSYIYLSISIVIGQVIVMRLRRDKVIL